MLRMPAFGLDGPWRDHSGFAQTSEQVSGIAWLTGTPEIEPLVRSTVDPIAGIHGAVAVLAALAHRRRTGLGQLIELPMAEVALNVAAEPIVTWSAYGTLLEREGDRGPNGSAARCLRVPRRRAVGGAVDRDATSSGERSVSVLGDPPWAVDAALATRSGRRAMHDDIDRELTAWFAAQDRDDVVGAVARGRHPRRAGVGPEPAGRAAAARGARLHCSASTTPSPVAWGSRAPASVHRSSTCATAHPRRPSASTRARCCASCSASRATRSSSALVGYSRIS